jgi:hypothetical protein
MYDIGEIKEQFCEVIRESQGIEEPQVDWLFDEWAKAKEKFIERFGGLIYEWPEPIEFTLDEKEKRYRAASFADRVHDMYNNPVLAEFIEENLDGFFDNKVVKACEGGVIPLGMKLLKAFKYFEHNKATLRNIQDDASLLIQENKIRGKLCFSVHPLDFLSSSENTYNWRSCHALDGEFRAGNLSYMTDRVTFMVYLKGMDDVELPNFGDVKWNSKKWRMLIYAAENDEIIFAGRQYPFSSRTGINTVLNIYNNLCHYDAPYTFQKYMYWSDDYIYNYHSSQDTSPSVMRYLDFKYLIINGSLVPLEDIVKQGPYALNYNDVLNSSCYQTPYYAVWNPTNYHSIEYMKEHPIVVGGDVKCLHCGDTYVEDTETMRCEGCEMDYGTEVNDVYTFCSCCGRRMYVDDAYIVGDELVCCYCFDSECFECDECGELFYNDEKHYCEETEMYLCSHCCYNKGERR